MKAIPYQIQYFQILSSLLLDSHKSIKSRVGDVKSRFSEKITVDLRNEFPLMDIKHVSFKNIYVELLWFISGNTNIKFLLENKCTIWTDDAFRWYNEKYVPMGAPKITKEEFVAKTLNSEKHTFTKEVPVAVEANFGFMSTENVHTYTYGDLDVVYGRQWRHFGGDTDQLNNIINTLKKNPDDRRMIITAHNPSDIQRNVVGLPSCHNYMQFYTLPIDLRNRVEYAISKNLMTDELTKLTDIYVFYKGGVTFGKHMNITNEVLENIHTLLDNVGVPRRYVSVFLNIRSNDFFLGNPYNIASYALLLAMIGQCVNMVPHTLSCEMVDCHLYMAHEKAAEIWIDRYTEKAENAADYRNLYCKSVLDINPNIKNIDEFTLADCTISNYESMGKIEAPLLT